MKMTIPLMVLLVAITGAVSADDWQADASDKLQVSVQESIEVFLDEQPALEDYFSQARGYAVFPKVVKIGAMWGGAWGRGLVFEDGRLIGRCSQLLASLGAQIGAQSYRQLILFRTDEAMDAFKDGRVEFEGRASAVAIKQGAASDPAYLPDVAIFTITNGGLMLEAAAAGVKYSYKPISSE